MSIFKGQSPDGDCSFYFYTMRKKPSFFTLFIRKISVLLVWAGSFVAQAQIISSEPVFPTQNDTVTLIYDASKGNAALVNLGPPEVYAHTGVITDRSTGPTNWRYVQGNWATDDAKVKMTYLGSNKYQIKYHIRSFYGVPSGENILRMAFVFRDRSGNRVGRESDGSDIFFDLYDGSLSCRILRPEQNNFIAFAGDTLRIRGAASVAADLTLLLNGNVIGQVNNREILLDLPLSDTGNFVLTLRATTGTQEVRDSLNFVVQPQRADQEIPAGMEDGITYLSDTEVHLQLYAPGKQFVYVLGDFNDWKPDTRFLMNRSPDGKRFWLRINGLQAKKPYAFQYFADGQVRVGDPYAKLVLDPWNDPFIPAANFSPIPSYPTGKTTGLVSVLQTAETPFNWSDQNYVRPKKTDLVIYELLVRDFIGTQNYKTLKDTLDYLQRLGINAIEFMPLNEFEGNLSWGYNPSCHSALDKYYGSADDFRELVNECHQRGMAVILDVVFNHAFSQSPMCQLYWDAANFRPSADNPWLNVIEKHPFNVGYDYNHESEATQYWMDKLLKSWIEDFHLDGFRFDLSKGFTQRNTLGDVGAWGRYDSDRIRLLKRMGNKLWEQDPGLFLILEHFADNDEETELANSGFMFWGNLVNAYNEAAMGYNANMEWGSYKRRGWNAPNLVTCLETHDEERLMYKNLQFGNVSGSYNVKNLNTALERVELAAALFFPLPGPKMIWQFTELGYDISINQNGRTGEKPLRWNYLQNPNRLKLYQTFAELIHLRTRYDAFESSDYNIDLASAVKRIWINHSSMDVLVLGNCDVKERLWGAGFQKTGRWYEFFSGDSVEVNNQNMDLSLKPGEYRIYTTKRIDRLYKQELSSTGPNFSAQAEMQIYPNPAADFLYVDGEFENLQVRLYDLQGKLIMLENDMHLIKVSGLPNGTYMAELITDNNLITRKRVVIVH